MRELAAAALLLAGAAQAQAGAWLQEPGQWQVIASFEASRASSGFDAQGRLDPDVEYDKLYMKSLVEYGWSERTTFFAAPELVLASYAPDRRTRDVAIEMGMRTRLFRSFGVASLQTSYKTAGPSDLSNSNLFTSAEVSEVRLLYGTDFRVMGRDGFLDFEAGQRFISRPRPDETVFDTTAGVWLAPKTLVMLQSFSTISGGNALPPDSEFRTVKLEMSTVQRLSPRWSLQLGVFATLDGRNSLNEQGLAAAFWVRL